MPSLLKALCTLLCFVYCLALQAQNWDAVIRHGTIVDGSGRPGFQGDVAIKDGRIAAVGKVEGTGKQEVEAAGLVVAPGFIDVHTHPENIVNTPEAENFIRMGVTTVIAGNCGTSMSDIGAFFRDLERIKISINVATLVGHNTVRIDVMGEDSARPPSSGELARMKGAVEQAMKDGALGLSTGLIYRPGKYAKVEEIIELAKVAAAYQGIYTSHVRNEQEGLIGSLEEALRVGREAKIPVQISHLKLSGNLIAPQPAETVRNLEKARADGLADKVVATLNKARQEGVKVSQDLYVYSAASAALDRLLPPEALEGGREALDRRLADPEQKAQIKAAMKQQCVQSGQTDYSHAVLVTARRFKPLQGWTIPEATQRRMGTNSLDAQIDMILDIEQHGGALMILYGMNEEDLLPFVRQPETMFASDSGTFQANGTAEVQHPRGYGNAARVLARYVREEKQLSLEEAVRRMTSLAATTFHLKDRGEIRQGAWADVVVFDPATVKDQATFASPHLCATGFKHVFVNGIETITNDRHNGARAGRALRRGE